jgi:dihydrofolate reductase
MISIIVAVSEDNGIGKDNELLWHIPEDLKRFKNLPSVSVS